MAKYSLEELEKPGGEALRLFREAAGPALIVSASHAGKGATCREAVRVQRAVGARSPSLAVATTMHHFSVAGLKASAAASGGNEWMLLEAIATGDLLVASGFAEGQSGRGILEPTMEARRNGDRYLLTGRKRPCSLARSMDLFTASVTLLDEKGEPEGAAVALLPKDSPGLSVRPFWRTPVLAGAESEEVVLDGVEVTEDLMVRMASAADQGLDELQKVGFVWFELLMSASYLGAASALAERLLDRPRIADDSLSGVLVPLEAAAAALEGAAGALDGDLAGADLDAVFARTLACRYAVQETVRTVAARCAELLGGMEFIGSGDVALLLASCSGLSLHPPSRARTAGPLCDYYRGAPLLVT
ncbi:acyl-CoA dehydrogenase family protein [Streptomyces sp. URMC 126]|uniref:acyl-CoA dehydrogenase family protein n=1 Tax=Streptomyces sp. URMC 126 TaxID=3423401 RepID=UPI003F1D9CD3